MQKLYTYLRHESRMGAKAVYIGCKSCIHCIVKCIGESLVFSEKFEKYELYRKENLTKKHTEIAIYKF